MKLLRATCFADMNNVAQLEFAIVDDGGNIRLFRFEIADVHVLLDAAEKMDLVGKSMLRHAPRPNPAEFKA